MVRFVNVDVTRLNGIFPSLVSELPLVKRYLHSRGRADPGTDPRPARGRNPFLPSGPGSIQGKSGEVGLVYVYHVLFLFPCSSLHFLRVLGLLL